MSQTSPQICSVCHTPGIPGQRFCANCGSVLPEQSATIAPTSASGPPFNSGMQPPLQGPYNTPSSPNYQPTERVSGPQNMPSSPNYQTTQQASNAQFGSPPPGYQPTERAAEPSNATPSGSGFTQYNTPPPPPSDPYGGAAPGTYPHIPASPVKKKRSALPFIIIGIIVVLVLACGGGGYAVYHYATQATNNGISNFNATATADAGGNPGGGGNTSTYPSTQALNLTIVYASDQITVTQLEQKSKFADDDLTQYSIDKNPNYVRMIFTEKQTSKNTSYFSYDSAFNLILPDGNPAKATKAQQFEGPDQAVQRTNWIDFQTSGQVDLTKLKLQLGTSDEAQMTVPLKSGADVSKYNPKTTTLNKQVNYASVNWTLKDATQSYYFAGSQAKTGQIYITIDMVANNTSSNDLFLTDFMRLKSGASTVSPADSSDTNNFDTINAGTTNVTGSVTFLVPPSPANTYTLDFLASTSDNTITEQTVDFQLS